MPDERYVIDVLVTLSAILSGNQSQAIGDKEEKKSVLVQDSEATSNSQFTNTSGSFWVGSLIWPLMRRSFLYIVVGWAFMGVGWRSGVNTPFETSSNTGGASSGVDCAGVCAW